MKFLKNILITISVAIFLFFVFLYFAEKSSGDTKQVFMILGVLVVSISIILLNLNLWSSLKKDYNATPKELINRNIQLNKYYIGEIFMFIVGIIILIYGFNQYKLFGFNGNSILYIIGILMCLLVIIKGLLSRKTRIEKITNSNVLEQNNLKRNNKIMVIFVVVLIILSYLFEFFR